jgi:hypothetical protein
LALGSDVGAGGFFSSLPLPAQAIKQEKHKQLKSNLANVFNTRE